MSLERSHTHEEIMAAEKEAARNPDVNTLAQDERWGELQKKLEGQRPAQGEDEVVTEEIVEGDEVASATKAETARVMRDLLSGI